MWHGAVDLLGSAIVRARVEWRSALRPHGRQMGASVYGAAVSESHCVAETHTAHALHSHYHGGCGPFAGLNGAAAACPRRATDSLTHTQIVSCVRSRKPPPGRGERLWEGGNGDKKTRKDTRRTVLAPAAEGSDFVGSLGKSAGLWPNREGCVPRRNKVPAPASASSPERTQRPGVA